MPILETNSDKTPDRIPPVPAGEYILDVSECSIESGTGKNEGKNVIVAKLLVNQQGSPFHGRSVYDRMALSGDSTNPGFGDVQFRHFQKACGLIPARSFDTESVIGKSVKAIVAVRTYPDKDTGEPVETNQIKKYLY